MKKILTITLLFVLLLGTITLVANERTPFYEHIHKNIFEVPIMGDTNIKMPVCIFGEGEKTKLMMLYMDILQVDSINYTVGFVLLLLCLLALAYFVVVFILFIILTIIANVKKLPPCIFRQYTAILCIVIKVIAMNNFILFSKLSKHSITIAQAKVNVGLNAVLAIIPIIYTVLLIIKFKKLECQKIEKILYIVSSVMGLIITLAIIVWQLYKL